MSASLAHVTIRAATPEERRHVRFHQSTRNLTKLARAWAAKSGVAVFVAEIDGRVVGQVMCDVATHRDGDARRFVRLFWMWVSAPSRDRGVGTRLMKRVERYARRHSANGVLLNVDRGNPMARRLYARRGYVAYAVQVIDRHKNDAMVLRLSANNPKS